MNKTSVLVVIPTFGALAYARAALRSLLASISPADNVELAALVVDDGTPADQWNDTWYKDAGGTVAVIRYEHNRGLTAAWNLGGQFAHTLVRPPDVLVLTNSDVLFPPGWLPPLLHALDAGWDFVGPITNAPGPTSGGVQDARRWGNWHSGAEPRRLAASAGRYHDAYGDRVEACDVNGFCMAGRTATWLKYAHAPPEHTFPPRIDVMPSGRKNPWPTQAGQEDWLMAKVRHAGGKTGACPGSLVMHFRGKSRGLKGEYAGHDDSPPPEI